MVTRAEKANRMKNILRELLQDRTYKWNEILEASAKIYEERYPGETPDANDLKGKIGSVLSLMEDGGEMRFEAGTCSLIRSDGKKTEDKAFAPASEEKKSEPAAQSSAPSAATAEAKPGAEKKPTSKTRKAPAKKAEPAAKKEEKTEEKKPEKAPAAPKKRAAAKVAKAALKPEETLVEKAAETPAPEKSVPAPAAEKPAAKKRVRKTKTEENTAEETKVLEGVAPKRRGRKPKAVQLLMPGAPEEVRPEPAEPKEPVKAPLPEQTLFDLSKEATSEEPVKTENETPGAETSDKKTEVVNPAVNEKTTEKTAEKPAEPEYKEKKENALTVKPEAKVAPVFDMTLLLGGKKDQNAGKKETAADKKPFIAEKIVAPSPAPAPQQPAPAAVVPASRETKPVVSATPSAAAADKPVSATAADKPVASEAAPAEQKREENVLSAALNAREPKKTVLPEFAFLGNAAAKPASASASGNGISQPSRGTAQALKEKEPARAGETQSGGANAGPVRSGNIAAAKPGANVSNATTDKLRQPAAQASVLKQSAPAVQPTQSAQPSRAKAQTEQALKPAEGGQGSVGGASNGRRGGHRGRGRTAAALPETPEGVLKAEFLKRLRSLGGDYFEYYSVYLLERYSLRNGRRLEGMRVSGGERDGGIDGEIELTDKFGFRETIYIQSKNWDPSKGDLDKWVVGETLLQQFIGAVACRQAKEGKRHSRGIFITTSHFTPEARELLETMSDNFIGYDEDDVFEAAKECSFGLMEKDGEWQLDEALLSGGKAFFNLL